MTDEERIKALGELHAAEAGLAAGNNNDVDPDALATELRAVRYAIVAAAAQQEETPITALRKGKGTACGHT